MTEPYLSIFSTDIVEQLTKNWTEQQPLKGTGREVDYKPVVKLFNPIGAATWLLTELDPESSLAFGLCDLGFGSPELGYVCLEEIYSLKLPGGIKIEVDQFFHADKTLSQYAEDARVLGHIRA